MRGTVLKVEKNDVVGTLRRFLGRMLESGFVDALLVPKALPGKDGYVQSLVRDVAQMADTNPLAPTMPVQSARVLSELTLTPAEGRIGAVLKPCEMKAVIELAKFLRVKLDNVVTIGVDCAGTYEVKDFAEMSETDRSGKAQALVDGAMKADASGTDGAIRDACRICKDPAPTGCDVTLCLLGSGSGEIAVLVGERFEKELAEKLGVEVADGVASGRDDAIGKLSAVRSAERSKVLGEMKGRVAGLDKLLDTFSTCVRCHNCMNVCPICYCKECVFRSSIFEHRAEQVLKLADKRGAVRMPGDTLIFHLTRLSHMGTSCVGCGLCDSACPNGLPVSRLFSLIGEELQGMFDYTPGRDLEEEAPVSSFREEELKATAGEH